MRPSTVSSTLAWPEVIAAFVDRRGGLPALADIRARPPANWRPGRRRYSRTRRRRCRARPRQASADDRIIVASPIDVRPEFCASAGAKSSERALDQILGLEAQPAHVADDPRPAIVEELAPLAWSAADPPRRRRRTCRRRAERSPALPPGRSDRPWRRSADWRRNRPRGCAPREARSPSRTLPSRIIAAIVSRRRR